MYVCELDVCLIPTEARRGHSIQFEPCRFWESNLSTLEEQQVLLTSEPSLQPLNLFFFFSVLIFVCLFNLFAWGHTTASVWRSEVPEEVELWWSGLAEAFYLLCHLTVPVLTDF